ncbi:MAG: hypothetical protein ABI462_00665 [Ignavibacteria bacterium]
MGLFNNNKMPDQPYSDSGTNQIYNLLFCDDISLFGKNNKQKNVYPWDILFSDSPGAEDLQKIIDDNSLESRVKILAYNKLISLDYKIDKKELLAVIVEVGLEGGLTVLASYKDGSARYINHTGKIIIWDAEDETSKSLTEGLFNESLKTVSQIGPWGKPRLATANREGKNNFYSFRRIIFWRSTDRRSVRRSACKERVKLRDIISEVSYRKSFADKKIIIPLYNFLKMPRLSPASLIDYSIVFNITV